jgi:hypothetical protein
LCGEIKAWVGRKMKRTGCNLTCAFCFGETRQQITDAHCTARSRSCFFIPSSSAYINDLPSMINACDASLSASCAIWRSAFAICSSTLALDTWRKKK